MNKIQKGKLIKTISTITGWTIMLISIIIHHIHELDVKSNLQGNDKILNDMGGYTVSDTTTHVLLGILIAGVLIWVIGTWIGGFMCTCPKCGAFLMDRHGSISEYCRKCGHKINY